MNRNRPTPGGAQFDTRTIALLNRIASKRRASNGSSPQVYDPFNSVTGGSSFKASRLSSSTNDAAGSTQSRGGGGGTGQSRAVTPLTLVGGHPQRPPSRDYRALPRSSSTPSGGAGGHGAELRVGSNVHLVLERGVGVGGGGRSAVRPATAGAALDFCRSRIASAGGGQLPSTVGHARLASAGVSRRLSASGSGGSHHHRGGGRSASPPSPATTQQRPQTSGGFGSSGRRSPVRP